MAEKSSNVTEGIPRWKIALAVGAPVAVGLTGLWLWRRRRNRASSKRTPDEDKVDAAAGNEVKHAEEKGLSPLEKAQSAKSRGNKNFKAGMYDRAIECYTEAISVCPTEHKQEMATFYQNRAAAYEQLKNQVQVVNDCTKALEYNNKYTKALFRRAKATEQMGDLMQCLEDVTAVCILEGFENQQSLLMADRVLKELGRTKAKQNYKTRGPVEPSRQFIRTYFSTFCNDPILAKTKTLSQTPEAEKEAKDAENRDASEKVNGEAESEKGRDETPEKEKIDLNVGDTGHADKKPSPYMLALQQLVEKQYDDVVRLCTEDISCPESPNLAEALLLRATFYHLRGEGNKALEDFDRLLALDNAEKRVRSNALIKRGSLRMQSGQQTEALDDFATAVREDPENSDIYHHRGQLNLLIDRVDDAVRDFTQSVNLSPQFAIAHVQKCYTEYRLSFNQRNPMQLQAVMKLFDEALAKFPDCAEGYALYGQALCDQQVFDKADERFTTALKLEPDNGNIFVHKGLLHLQWKQDIEKATQLISQAIKVDEKCEFAYETLGTIEVQRGNLTNAMELFNKAISLARTEIEMAHLYSLLDAAIAQSRVAKNFGIQVPV